jgi:Zn-dependent protease with chaperone function
VDFFGAQDHARKLSFRLVLMFALSLLGLILTTNLLLAMLFVTLSAQAPAATGAALPLRLDPLMFVLMTVGILVVVALASLYKTWTLRGGGRTVAEALGARLLQDDGRDPIARRTLNVVEEMAIAAGTPVPPVYVLEEAGINAFAAGYSSSDAVIGITRGAMTKLSRDELQGVVAHEFSHILHGDMRLNIRLIGLIHGIMVVGMMGYYLLRSASMSRRNNGGAALLMFGLGLVVIGAAGTFFGRLIKSAVSRQREFLADASAVQYTRNRDGIAGALKRIGADAQGSQINNPAAEEISHALFGAGSVAGLRGLFATHPPLAVRIRRLQADWDGRFELPAPIPPASDQHASTQQPPRAGLRAADLIMALPLAMQRIGNPDSADLACAAQLHAALPAALLGAARSPFGARAVAYLLLLDEDPAGRDAQLSRLRTDADPAVMQVLDQLMAGQPSLALELRLPLLNIALGALRQLTPQQYGTFRSNVQVMAQLGASARLSVWMARTLLLHHLDRAIVDSGVRLTEAGDLALADVQESARLLLSLLAHLGGQQQAESAYACALARLSTSPGQLLPANQLSLALLETALSQLLKLGLADKQQLLTAALAGIHADQSVNTRERDLVATLAEILDVPLPASW